MHACEGVVLQKSCITHVCTRSWVQLCLVVHGQNRDCRRVILQTNVRTPADFADDLKIAEVDVCLSAYCDENPSTDSKVCSFTEPPVVYPSRCHAFCDGAMNTGECTTTAAPALVTGLAPEPLATPTPRFVHHTLLCYYAFLLKHGPLHGKNVKSTLLSAKKRGLCMGLAFMYLPWTKSHALRCMGHWDRASGIENHAPCA